MADTTTVMALSYPEGSDANDVPADMSATTKADGRTLPWRILGRQVRPYALAELDAAIRDAEV